jgi:hypothetical protein
MDLIRLVGLEDRFHGSFVFATTPTIRRARPVTQTPSGWLLLCRGERRCAVFLNARNGGAGF